MSLRSAGLWALLASASCSSTPKTDAIAPAETADLRHPPLIVTDTLSGTIRFRGKVHGPHGKLIEARHACSRHKVEDVARESLLVGPDWELANVFVSVTGGLPVGQEHPTPVEPIVVAWWCICFQPRVVAVRMNQPLVLRNCEDVGHYLHRKLSYAAPFDSDPPMKAGDQVTLRYDRAEPVFALKCDIHPYETAWVHVIAHPYFAITGADGRYQISGLPEGEYEVTAWHEKFNERRIVSKVRIQAGAEAPVDVTFEGKP